MALFTFQIAKGVISGPNGVEWHSVWSGHGEGINDPAAVDWKDIGPLPPGEYVCGPLESTHAVLGPFVMALTRTDEGPDFGRGGFYIHGASALHPELSSDGCVIVPRAQRVAMDAAMTAAGDRGFLVIAG
jgi:hypothetical protein